MERVNEFLSKNPHLKLKVPSTPFYERLEAIKKEKFKAKLMKNVKESVKTRVKLLKLKKEIEKVANEPVVLEKKKKLKGEKKSKKTLSTGEETGNSNTEVQTSVTQDEDGTNGISLAGLSEGEARDALWKYICRKQIPKLVRSIHQGTSARIFNSKKISQAAAGLVKRQNSRLVGKPITAARRAMKEMLAFWKRNEKEERDLRKRAEKEAAERRRIEEEQREARRQAKKLNFLITQTELYSHFVGRKQGSATGTEASGTKQQEPTLSKEMDFADVDDSVIRAEAERIAKNAAAAHQAKLEQFQSNQEKEKEKEKEKDMDFMNPSTLKDATILEQPSLMQVTLKSYQLKGLTWLASLYEQVTRNKKMRIIHLYIYIYIY